MEVINPGHTYELTNFENPNDDNQVIQFIEKAQNKEDDLVTVNDGTTNEEVLEMLIDRLKHLNEKLPSRETSISISKLEEALMWQEKRTKDREKRGVEGTYEK